MRVYAADLPREPPAAVPGEDRRAQGERRQHRRRRRRQRRVRPERVGPLLGAEGQGALCFFVF